MKKTLLALSLSLASLCLSTALANSFPCGMPDKNVNSQAHENWCRCTHEFMSSENGMCYQMGGDDDTCTDSMIREVVKDLNGPEATCATAVPSELKPLCDAVLPHYIEKCKPVA